MKTAELTGAALDWAVAKCERFQKHAAASIVVMGGYGPSTDWAQGGPIIERMGENGLILMRATTRKLGWRASLDFPNAFFFGPTPLVAAMRCYVASRLGDEVKIPRGL